MMKISKKRVRRLKREILSWVLAIIHDLVFCAIFTVLLMAFMFLVGVFVETFTPVVEFIFSI